MTLELLAGVTELSKDVNHDGMRNFIESVKYYCSICNITPPNFDELGFDPSMEVVAHLAKERLKELDN